MEGEETLWSFNDPGSQKPCYCQYIASKVALDINIPLVQGEKGTKMVKEPMEVIYGPGL